MKLYPEKGIVEIDGKFYFVVVKQPLAHEKPEWFLEELTPEEIEKEKLP
jgi:hypothetical protein